MIFAILEYFVNVFELGHFEEGLTKVDPAILEILDELEPTHSVVGH